MQLLNNSALPSEETTNFTTNDIKPKLKKSECNDIGKTWTRNCPECNTTLSYTIYRSYWNAEHNKRLCRSCVRKVRYPLPSGIWIDNKNYCRQCPECKNIIKYNDNKHTKHRVIKAHLNKKICIDCVHKKQSETLKRIKEKQKINLTCIICNNSFEVNTNRYYTKCCSQQCRTIARNQHLIPTEIRKTMTDDEIKLADKLYKYREWDRIHNLVCDWDLSSFRSAIKDGKCQYCNRTEWLGLDRINNKLGHSKLNTVICCELCNMTRGNRFTYDEMIIIGKTIKSLNITNRRNSRQGNNNNIFKNQ